MSGVQPLRVVTVVGARPQFIKAAPVSRALAAIPNVEELMIHSGQHYDADMSDVFFGELGIPAPVRSLNIGSGSHGQQTGRMLHALEDALLEMRPDMVLTFGDTNTTLAAALAAAKLHIPVAHVEAGVRSFNRRMPEEINRVVTDHISTYLFAPTATAATNLANEGIADGVHIVGDVMLDAALHFGDRVTPAHALLSRLNILPLKYVLASIHRPENTDDALRLRAIVAALEKVGRSIRVVLPLHPRTRNALDREGLLSQLSAAVSIIGPVSYLEMVALEKYAKVVVTDSGGVQKEAFFYRVPCVTLRDETEWVELVDAGWNRVVPPTCADDIVMGIRTAIGAGPGADIEPYGYGDAATRIVGVLVSHGRRNGGGMGVVSE